METLQMTQEFPLRTNPTSYTQQASFPMWICSWTSPHDCRNKSTLGRMKSHYSHFLYKLFKILQIWKHNRRLGTNLVEQYSFKGLHCLVKHQQYMPCFQHYYLEYEGNAWLLWWPRHQIGASFQGNQKQGLSGLLSYASKSMGRMIWFWHGQGLENL